MRIKFFVLLIACAFIFIPSLSNASVPTRTVWQATKLLTINMNNNPGTELSRVKRKFAIGPGEWQVTYEENSVPKYVSTWKLPQLPDCYRNYNLCLEGSQMARDYLWAAAFEDDRAHNSWTFELLNPDSAELFVDDWVCNGGCNNQRDTFGQGAIAGVNDDNTVRLLTTGMYGWAHGKFENAAGGSIFKSGAMIPLHWRVEGRFQ